MTRRHVWAVAVTVLATAACTAVMVPLRPHLAEATDALLLILPVLVGVTLGGFTAGAVGAGAGFLVYDWFFIPPYGTLTVGAAQNWLALVVYLVIVLVVARVVATEQAARARASSRERAVRRLVALTEALIAARPLASLLTTVVETVHELCGTRWVVLLLPRDGQLTVVAVAGEALTESEHDAVLAGAGTPQSLTLVGTDHSMSRVALTSTVGPVGQLVVADGHLAPFEREVLRTFANEAALAIERAQLREDAVRVEALETADRWRSALMGAVSHDLRTPLASVKLAVSTLSAAGPTLSAADRDELLVMVERQVDHLTRLVANVLDMARLETGGLVPAREAHGIEEIVAVARRSLGTALDGFSLAEAVDPECPLVDVDVVLVGQVLTNLLANATQHAPPGSTITVGASGRGDGVVTVWVDDEGPGIAPDDRAGLFHMVDRRAGSGRAGLGLSIARAFVEAHGGRLSVTDAPGGGARFTFTLPAATVVEAVS